MNRWIFRRLPVALNLALCSAVFCAERSLVDLEREAKAVLSLPDNVARRKQIAPVFQLAERYVALGRTNQAVNFYKQALEHEPWNLSAQLALAQLLNGLGDTNAARQKAELVWNYAETDSLLGRAAKMLGTPFAPRLPENEPWPTETFGLALVPYGDVEAWLVLALREELQKTLGIPVVIRQLPLEIPKPNRDALRLKAQELRERIARAYKHQEFRLALRRLNFSTNMLTNDQAVFTFTAAVLNAEKDKEPAKLLEDELAFLARLGPQWDASALLEQLAKALPVHPGSGMGYLGVTAMDLYAGTNRFVFAQAAFGGNCAIISYRRFTSLVTVEPPNRDRLKQRTLKQALSSVGLLFGIPRCTDPTCTRAYAHSLVEHDAKQLRLCPQCQEGFAKRFRRQLD